MARAPSDPDLVFRVDRAGDHEGRFAIFAQSPVRSRGREEPPALPLGAFDDPRRLPPVKPHSPWTNAFDELRADYQSLEGSENPDALKATIRRLGHRLWGWLPPEFRDFYWPSMHGRRLSVVVRSVEGFFPWELVWPEAAPTDAETDPTAMFGIAFALGRWTRDDDLPERLAFAPRAPAAAGSSAGGGARFGVIESLGDTGEVGFLLSDFGAEPIEPANRDGILAAIRTRKVKAIHARTHGFLGPDGPFINVLSRAVAGSAINFSPSDLSERDPRVIAGLDDTFLFLNACSAAFSTRLAPGGPEDGPQIDLERDPDQRAAWLEDGRRREGWGARLARFGAAGFVGPYWDVSPSQAARVAEQFYRLLHGGVPIGEAMRTVRSRLLTAGADGFDFRVTCLAYPVYSHPNLALASGQDGAVGPKEGAVDPRGASITEPIAAPRPPRPGASPRRSPRPS